MRINIVYILLGLSLLIPQISIAQAERGLDVQPLTKIFAKTNFRVPFATSNAFFNETARGVVDMSGSLMYSPIKNFYFGAGYKYTFFKLSEIKLNASPNEQYDARIELQGFFGEMSYIYPLYENVMIEGNIQIGREEISSSSRTCRDMGMSNTKRGLFVSPNLNIYILTEEVFSFYFSAGYTFSSQGFNPEDVCETGFSGFESNEFLGNYGSINVGLGIGISFIKPSKL